MNWKGGPFSRGGRSSIGEKRVMQGLRPRVELLEVRAMLTTLPTGFMETTVTTGLAAPTAMEFSPDGRLWALEQGGNVKLINSNGSVFTALHQTVDSRGERGMLGIAFDPNFTTNHFVYLYYTNPNPGGAPWAMGEHNQLSRFTVDDSTPGQPAFTNEAPILDWNNLIAAQNHNGGAIHFGKDGMLYADAGDNTQMFVGPDGGNYRVSQSMDTLLGKQLRIDVSKFNTGAAGRDDVTVGDLIPTDNPFVGTATGINQLIYALGLRNPFTFAVQPGTGRILINDVGENTWEEIDDSIAGGNYGWSGGNTDGFGNPPPMFAAGTYHDPLLAYAHSGMVSQATGTAIVGGTFYNPPTVQFPSSYVGMYFYEDLGSGFIRYFNPNAPNSASAPDGNSVAFASNTPGGLRDLKVDSLGNLYYLAGNDGSIRKISVISTVASRLLFYNQSAYDNNTAGVDPLDDSAISNKVAYLPGGTASTNAATAFAHESNYTQGINGLMVDLTPGATHSSITASDFVFRVGVDDGSGHIVFANATAGQLPTTITTRAGAGATGSDRVEMIWANNSLRNVWLEVQVLADANTGLAQHANDPAGIGDIFYFANKAGDTGNDNGGSYITNSTDLNRIRSNAGNSEPVDNTFDVNKDSIVNSTDGNAARSNSGNMAWFSVALGGPFAPDAGPPAPDAATAAPAAAPSGTLSAGIGSIVGVADAALASGITSLLTNLGSGVPSWLQSRLSNVLESAPVVNILHTLAQHDSAVDRTILQTIDSLADKSHLNDDVLDGLLADLGLE